jgi:hypothetical protein
MWRCASIRCRIPKGHNSKQDASVHSSFISFTCISRYVMTTKDCTLISLSFFFPAGNISKNSTIKLFDSVSIIFYPLCQMNLCHTHSKEVSATFTNLLHVGEVTYFHRGNLVSYLYTESRIFECSLSFSEALNLVQDSRPGTRGVYPEQCTQ